MDSNIERRKHRRFVYEAEISHDILTHNKIYKGRLSNFSKGGLYFESNQDVFPGEEVFIKFEGKSDLSADDMMAHLPFGVEIVWQNQLPESSFRYGYGANYIDGSDSLVRSVKIAKIQQKNSQLKIRGTEKDPRDFPRRQYHKTLQLSYKSQKCKGEVINISRSGVFIKTDIRFDVGRPIKIVIPGSKIRGETELKGYIVRICSEGFGVKFDRKFDHRMKRRLASPNGKRGKASKQSI